MERSDRPLRVLLQVVKERCLKTVSDPLQDAQMDLQDLLSREEHAADRSYRVEARDLLSKSVA